MHASAPRISSDAAVSPTGRRERNRLEKLDRISASARTLFDDYGYEAVTTQQIAEHADVAVGTVFLYARTKAELLIMVQNELFRAAVRAGVQRAQATEFPSATEAILALLTPVLEGAAVQPENTIAYQRELLFGASTERYRSEGIAIVLDLECHIAELLAGDASLPPVKAAARSIFGAVHLTISQVTTRAHAELPNLELLALQVAQIVAGFRATTHESSSEGATQ
ncbi:hypothetical protein BH11ACT2_BH11ACT2_09730 [soil metagenome]